MGPKGSKNEDSQGGGFGQKPRKGALSGGFQVKRKTSIADGTRNARKSHGGNYTGKRAKRLKKKETSQSGPVAAYEKSIVKSGG